MAHLLYFLNGKSFVKSPDSVCGVLEEIEENADRRQYGIENIREGSNIPTQSQWKFFDTRIKQHDSLPYFARDLKGINLNPTNNKTSIFDVLRGKDPRNQIDTVGRLFLLIRWAFKWLNRKKTTATILFVLGTISLQFWLYIIALAVLVNPLKPVPIAEGTPLPFTNHWYYCILIGVLNDTWEIDDERENTRQEDIL
jgi:hypothetical protein